MPPIISFSSDFGTSDPYVAAVKAVMLRVAPGAQIVDVTHGIGPQALAEAVFLTEQAWPYFPTGTVHLIVVDPGVGTDRAALALRTPQGFAVGPDNGVLSAALPADLRGAPDAAGYEARTLDARLLPPGYAVRQLTTDLLRTEHPSATFHGRDWFGPAAAFVAAGGRFEDCGPTRGSLLVLPRFEGVALGGAISGPVIHVDHFGNLQSVIRGEQLPPGAKSAVLDGITVPLVRTYGEADGLVALIGSSGYLEVALVNGSAAAMLGVGAGALVTVGRP